MTENRSPLTRHLMSSILDLLPDELIIGVVMAFLDNVEEKIKTSETPIDDYLLLPLINTLRAAIDRDIESGRPE